jgi:hypothetical protein
MAYKDEKGVRIGDDILDLDEASKKNEKSLNAIKLSKEEYNHYRKTDDSVADSLLD